MESTLLRRLTAHEADLRRQADEVAILIGEARTAPSDPLLGLKQIKERYGCGRWAIRSAIDRQELSATKGPHNDEYLIRQSELERWLSSKPHVPRTPKPVEWRDDPDAEAERQLQRLTRGAP
jgi:hypothetical protein